MPGLRPGFIGLDFAELYYGSKPVSQSKDRSPQALCRVQPEMKPKTISIILSLLLASMMSVMLAQKNMGETTAGRFDMAVREDFFSGMAGDAAAFTRAMKQCEERLAARPRDPEALVWHGAGLYFQAGRAFMAGDIETGMRLRDEGVRQMDNAVQLS